MNASPSSQELAIKIQGVDKGFGDGATRLRVLKDIHFEARKGEIMMLVGPSGCGKTTLLSIIAGTLAPDSGSIEVLGNRLDGAKNGFLTQFRAKHIGFIFQAFNLIPTLSIQENVSVPLLIQGHRAKVAEARAAEVLDQVGLGDRLRHRPNQLSGGQQQRVAIARALVHNPPLIICDEPTAALDAKNGHVVMDLFSQVAKDPERCVVIVTHDNRIYPYADRIARMDDGCLVETLSAEEAAKVPHF